MTTARKRLDRHDIGSSESARISRVKPVSYTCLSLDHLRNPGNAEHYTIMYINRMIYIVALLFEFDKEFLFYGFSGVTK